jgi:cytochrome b6-f complex iron-sulfur subunit
MAKKKLTTEEILAAARAQAGGGKPAPPAKPSGAEETATADSAPEVEPASEAPAARAPATKPTPKSTQDILAAARAQAGAKPAAESESEQKVAPSVKPSGGGPKSTADILAAARAQAAGGGGKAAAPKPATPAGGSPKSTADILAAARVQASGKPAGASKPEVPAAAPKKPAAKAKQAAAAAGERPSVQEMIRAAREGRKIEEAAAPKRLVPARVKHGGLAEEADSDILGTRRGALFVMLASIIASPFALAWWAFGAASGVFTLAMLRFMMPNVLVEPPSRFKVGPPSDYPGGTVSDKWKSQFGVWVVHTTYGGRDVVYALASICTHLGCTPNWLETEQKFKCPCHGSGFYITGINFEGPAPRPLERYAIRLAPDGMLEVDKSTKYQQEMGQWDDPNSFVEVA